MTDVCTGFEPQNYLKDRCRKCFRPKDKHVIEEEEIVAIPVVQMKRERRKSWHKSTSDNGAPEDVSISEDVSEILSVSSYLSATSKGLSSVKSQESVHDTKSMVTAVSGSIDDDQRALTPTSEDEKISSLKDEVRRLRELIKQMKEDQEEATLRRNHRQNHSANGSSEQTLIQMLEERLNEAENSIQDYRDENTVLKCELRELQETTFANSDQKLTEKLKTTETLCDELMEENEQLKGENRDLQHEIEEMQDQYREEEIEEFRELQRELEQNAKNCRVLQFKLRKAERMKEQADVEKFQMQSKLNDILATSSDTVAVSLRSDGLRVKELETELRIAKEVSVRLHNELEQTEEKRYKLEDEVFYLKEKVRELQTQSKWREARNRTDNAVKRLSAELSSSAVSLPEGEVNKELRDALEREVDLREQLRFAEEDLKRTQEKMKEMEAENESLLKKLAKATKLRPPMVRSASEGNAHLQLELAEHEVEHLSSKVERLEKTNDHLTKKILELETDCTKRTETAARLCSGEFKLTPEMHRDMSKMLTTISDLERKNLELSAQLKSYESKSSSNNTTAPTPAELRSEQEKRRVVEVELNELKQVMLKTDNQKLIALATKIEQLNNQLSMANDRCNTLHKKAAKEGDQAKYADDFKTKLETLERQLSEKKATETIQELQGTVPTSDEIEQICEVLASIESQTNRLTKQIEKIEMATKDERRRSLSKDSAATIISELAHLMQEMKNVHKLMDGIKTTNPTLMRRSPLRELAASPRGECPKCKENEKALEEQQNEIVFYKKKNKDLTNQVLQTEDRWTIEIEKQRQIFENEIKNLGLRISDMKRQIEEQSQTIESKSSALFEKTRALEEAEEKTQKLQKDLDENRKDLLELETDKKTVKEYEIKYKKLESIFDTEREKMNSERNRTKNELVAVKKIADDAEDLLKRTTEELRKKEAQWKSEKATLDREITSLKKQLAAFKNVEGVDHEDRASSHDSDVKDNPGLIRSDSEKLHIIDLKKQIAQLEKRHSDVSAKLEEVKINNAELTDELNKTKQGWQKEKEAFQHKTRQTEKIRSVEMDALQQKFSSRMRIMEDTNKSLHSQLVLARRERDTHKETLAKFEKKTLEEQKANEQKIKLSTEAAEKAKGLQVRVADLEAELERVNTDLRLTKEARKADGILYGMDRSKGKHLSAEDKKKVEGVQQQYKECEKFYAKEVDRLNDRIKEITQAALQQKTKMTKTMRELRETIRVLEIDQRNLSQNKDSHQAAKELLEAETERLQQVIHLHELQKLTRKYRLSSIIDQLQYVTGRSSRESDADGIRYIVGQLTAIRDEDGNTVVPDDRASQVSTADRCNYAPSISECDGTYDNISQSSFSIRSVTSMPVRTTKWTNNQASVVSTIAMSPIAQSPNPPSASSSYATFEKPSSGYPTKRSFSTESHTGFDRYGRINGRRSEVPNSFLKNLMDEKEKIEFDKDGHMRYVTKSMPRTASYDNRSDMDDEEPSHSRTGSAGTNILYRVRREELARGGQPSVKLMAKAFESQIDEPTGDKRGFFSIRKSRSVETTADRANKKKAETSTNPLKYSHSTTNEQPTSAYATMPRGGRNPFKQMGSKLVERVRRSLSRSSRAEKEKEDESTEPVVDVPVKEKGSSSPKKTKKKSAEAKARKSGHS